MNFKIDEFCILNEKVSKALPNNVGEYVRIARYRDGGSYQYEVQLASGDYAFVKDSELDKLTKEQEQLVTYIHKGNTVVYKLSNEEVKILKTDFIHGQVEVLFDDGASCIVGMETLKELKKESDSVEEKFNLQDLLIDTFLSQYKNNDNTYTVPKIVLQKLIDHMVEEVE